MRFSAARALAGRTTRQALLGICLLSFLGTVLWLVVEGLLQAAGWGIQLQDWLFTASFWLFLISAPLLAFLSAVAAARRRLLRLLLALLCCGFMLVAGYWGFLIKGLVFGGAYRGSRYASATYGTHTYTKTYFSYSAMGEAYSYRRLGFLLLFDPERAYPLP